MDSYNVADAKAHLSDILDRVSKGEEILLTRRGEPIARLVPAARTQENILGAGRNDPNINFEVIERNQWWMPASSDDIDRWYE